MYLLARLGPHLRPTKLRFDLSHLSAQECAPITLTEDVEADVMEMLLIPQRNNVVLCSLIHDRRTTDRHGGQEHARRQDQRRERLLPRSLYQPVFASSRRGALSLRL